MECLLIACRLLAIASLTALAYGQSRAATPVDSAATAPANPARIAVFLKSDEIAKQPVLKTNS
jgi:hypothetical protein